VIFIFIVFSCFGTFGEVLLLAVVLDNFVKNIKYEDLQLIQIYVKVQETLGRIITSPADLLEEITMRTLASRFIAKLNYSKNLGSVFPFLSKTNVADCGVESSNCYCFPKIEDNPKINFVLGQVTDLLGTQMETGPIKTKKVDKSNWPILLRLVSHGVLYRPAPKSHSADFYYFFAPNRILAIQCKSGTTPVYVKTLMNEVQKSFPDPLLQTHTLTFLLIATVISPDLCQYAIKEKYHFHLKTGQRLHYKIKQPAEQDKSKRRKTEKKNGMGNTQPCGSHYVKSTWPRAFSFLLQYPIGWVSMDSMHTIKLFF